MKTIETPLTWILIPLFLFLITYQVHERQELIAEAEVEAEVEAATEARALVIANRTITLEIEHDSDPSTTIYPVKISANRSFDADRGDSLSYTWNQINGVSVNFLDDSKNTLEAKFEAESGEYEFVLSISDSYGASCSDTVIISVQPEPNNCPTAIIEK